MVKGVVSNPLFQIFLDPALLTENNKSLLSWVVTQPPPYAQKKSARCRIDSPGAARNHYSLWKPLLIVETSLKVRYFDFIERSYSIDL